MPEELDHEYYMMRAFRLAKAGYEEGGCPIGGVLVRNSDGKILGEDHNRLVQDGTPTAHGEMAALDKAGRMKDRHDTTMYTTLTPCFQCAGAIVMFGIPRVVIGDSKNSSDETIEFMRSKGVEVIKMDMATSAAAWSCVALDEKFIAEKPEQWLEDWGGGPNPVLVARRDSHS